MRKNRQEGGWTSAASMLIWFLIATNLFTISLLEITTRKLEAAVQLMCKPAIKR